MLENSLAVVNSKGGVGKTSIVANVAVAAARAGWRVLAVDLDAQGNLSRDLGYHAGSDEGRALLQAVVAGQPLEPLRAVRERVDVVAGGRHTKRLADLLMVQALGQGGDYSLEETFASTASAYDLMLLDCPPVFGPMVRDALRLAHFVVIPTKVDDGSIDGLEGLADEISDVIHTANSQLRVVGVVLFDVGAGDTRLRSETRAELDEMLEGIAPVLQATIRHSRRGARDMRRLGQVAAEYERAASDAQPWFLDRSAPSFSSAAAGLAGDYEQLTAEILQHLGNHRTGGARGATA
ncbi:MAG: ParA family protein [Egibacteraceae bacterium]